MSCKCDTGRARDEDSCPIHGGVFAKIDAERKAQAAEDFGCTEDELEPCEACPIIDEICEACGCTGWVMEGTQ